MRKTARALAGVFAAVLLAGPVLAQEAFDPGPLPDAADENGRYIMDAPPVPVQRRDFQRERPVVVPRRGEDFDPALARQIAQAEELDELPARQHPPEVIREAPEVSLNGARVAGADTEALAYFYESAFGLWEVQRIELPGGPPEIMLNFGDSAEEARANTAGDIVIYPREGGPPEGDDVAHLVFNVSDVEAVVDAAVQYGAEIVVPVTEFGDSGIFISYVADPEGNQVELIQGAQ